jgi:hypothetical protein
VKKWIKAGEMEKHDVGIKVTLVKPDNFLLCKETLSRIGVSNNKERRLYQTAHILHRKGNYYICHFKSLFELDGKPSTISPDDILRRNTITKLLHDWGLLIIDDLTLVTDRAPMSAIKILPFGEKGKWQLIEKYSLGNKY